MSKQMLELADRLSGSLQPFNFLTRDERDLIIAALRCSAESEAETLLRRIATSSCSEGTMHDAIRAAKDYVGRRPPTEPQASVMRAVAARWLDDPEVKSALHRRTATTEPQSLPLRGPDCACCEQRPSKDCTVPGCTMKDAEWALPARQTLESLICEYARDLRRNSSGGDDYPWEWAKATADYLETLIDRSRCQAVSAPIRGPDCACCEQRPRKDCAVLGCTMKDADWALPEKR
jgi:hypothetical protein